MNEANPINPMPSTLRKLAVYLTNAEIIVVALAVGACLASDRALLPALIALILFWPVRWLAWGTPGVRTAMDGAALLLLLTVPGSLWITVQPQVTLPQVLRLLVGLLSAYSLINWTRTPDRLRFLSLGLALGGMGLAGLAPFAVQWNTSKLSFIPRSLYTRFTVLTSDTINPNVMGGSLAFLLPMLLALLLFAWSRLAWLERLLFGIILALMAYMLLLTQSRGALLGTGVALLCLVALRWPRQGWMTVPVLTTVLITVPLEKFNPLLDATFGPNALSGLDARMEIWSQALHMVRDFAYTGIGMGSFGRVADLRYPFSFRGIVPHAHNLFLQVAVDLGVPGLVAWLAILFAVCQAGVFLFRQGRRHGDPWISGLGAGILASQVVLLVHGITDATLWGMTRPALLVWIVWGVGLAGQQVVMAQLVGDRGE